MENQVSDNRPQKRILLVDDNIDHMQIVKLILEQNGYLVETSHNCKDLVLHIHAYRPELIFMDHAMPVITGLEATRLIKSDDKSKHIPVVYFSSRDDIRELAELAGADDWLIKPFRPDDLITKAEKFLCA